MLFILYVSSLSFLLPASINFIEMKLKFLFEIRERFSFFSNGLILIDFDGLFFSYFLSSAYESLA